MFSNKLRLFFIAIYAGYVLLALFLYGIPSNASEAGAIFVVPGLASAFLYFFYSSLASRAKTFGTKKPPRL